MQERRDQPDDRKIERSLKKNRLKLFIVTAFFCGVTLVSFSQKDSTAFSKLQTEFNGAFLQAGGKPEITFFDQLYTATSWVLNVQNPTFRNARKEQQNILMKNGDSLMIKMAETIYKTLPADIFWKNQQVDLLRFQKLLEIANEKLCSCVSDKIRADKKKTVIWALVSQCDSLLNADTAYQARIRTETKRFSHSELLRAQRAVIKYLYANCSFYRRALNSILAEIVLDNYYSFGQTLAQNLEEEITRFSNGNPDSLSILFPDHARYKTDIEQSSLLISKKEKWIGNWRREPGTNQSIQTRTYYKKGIPTIFLGQTICYYEQEDTIIRVKGFRFITPDKIENKTELLNDINIEVPPPRRPEIRPQPGKQAPKKH
jgi:uncharacterized protein YecT (DUF1311 family)